MLLKAQFFENKKATFQVKKKLWPVFSRNADHDKPQSSIHKDPKGFLDITVEAIRSFL